MKHWQETTRIFDRLSGHLAAGQPAVVATVVRIDGSAYRRPGAKLLVDASGGTMGGVSGGCLEADVCELGRQVMERGGPALRRYETGKDDDILWGLGLGCDGTVEVLVQPVRPGESASFDAAVGWLRGERRFALATVIAGPRIGAAIVCGPSGEIAGSTGDAAMDDRIVRCAREAQEWIPRVERIDDVEVFVDALSPPPWMVIVGAGDDARPLAALAGAVGFRVAVADHREAYLTAERFPDAARLILGRPDDDLTLPPGDAYAVVMTHSLDLDREWVRRLSASSRNPYIGVLGPRARTQRIVDETGAPADRVYGPVGLDLGADGPEQVAVSIVSEVLAVQAHREPGHLRHRSEAIHLV